MAQLQTLGGPIETADLGTVLMHEHIFNISLEVQGCWPGFNGWDPDVEIPKAQQTLKELKDAGYDTIVELSVCGLGRDVGLMSRAVEGTGLQVTVATGLYTYDVLPRLWHFSGPGTLLDGEEQLDELMRRDIEEGIEGTDIKAAMLKCAVDHDGLTPHVERVDRLAGGLCDRVDARHVLADIDPVLGLLGLHLSGHGERRRLGDQLAELRRIGERALGRLLAGRLDPGLRVVVARLPGSHLHVVAELHEGRRERLPRHGRQQHQPDLPRDRREGG